MKNCSRRKKSFANIPIKRVLILCEGESEQIYINNYRSEEKNKRRLSSVDVEIYQPKNYSPYGLLKEAKRKAKEAKKDKLPYNYIWIIFDKDFHANIPKTFEEAIDFGINIIFSSICFEVWILLHFEKTSKCFKDCEELCSYLSKKKHIEYSKTNYLKDINKCHFEQASDSAKWLRKTTESELKSGKKIYELDCYTNFDILIEFLENL